MYRGERGTGTTIYLDAAADAVKTVGVVLATLDLDERDAVWVAPGRALGTGVR